MSVAAHLRPVLVVLVGCAASTPAEPLIPLPEDPAERTLALKPLGPNPFVWRVRCPGKSGWGFLVGSVHVRDKASTTLPEPLEGLVQSVDTVAFETRVPGAFAALVQLYKLGGFRFLKRTELDDTTWQALETRLAPLKLGRRGLQNFAPWALFFLVMAVDLEAAELSPDTGIDHLMEEQARRHRPPKEVRYMETAESQLRLFSDLPEIEQIRMLKETLQSTPLNADDVVALYAAQDFAGMEEQVLASFEGHLELRERLLDARNRTFEEFAWSLYEQPGTSVVVAGAAHMLGEAGLPKRLEARRCQVEQGSKTKK